MVLLVGFQIILVVGSPELAVAVANLLPLLGLPQTFEVIRVFCSPITFILELARSLTGRLRTDFLLRMILIGSEFCLADLAAHENEYIITLWGCQEIFDHQTSVTPDNITVSENA